MTAPSSPPPDAERYSRQLRLRVVGPAGQERLAAARALVVGTGALGSRIAELLVRAGVGFLRLVDRDIVEVSNLPRQALFDEDDVAAGRPKAEAAALHLGRICAAARIEARVADLHAGNVRELMADVDVVLDGTDNVETRYLVNDAAVALGRPWIYGGVVETRGMVLPVHPGAGPCLRCVFPDPPGVGELPTCDTVGVLGPVPTLIAALQATAALRAIVEGAPAAAALLRLDAWTGDLARVTVERDPGCPCCGARRFEFLDVTRTAWVTTLCGRNAVQITPAEPRPVDLQALATSLGAAVLGGWLRVHVPPHELWIFPDGRVIVRGTTDEALARTLRDRLLG